MIRRVPHASRILGLGVRCGQMEGNIWYVKAASGAVRSLPNINLLKNYTAAQYTLVPDEGYGPHPLLPPEDMGYF